jgi:hypothetical protein
MAVQDEILRAGSILDDAAKVVDKGLSIFERIGETFKPIPTTPDSALQSTPTAAPVPTAGASIVSDNKALIVIAVLVAAYIILGR